jgi:iron complex transport system ATP-binding protein
MYIYWMAARVLKAKSGYCFPSRGEMHVDFPNLTSTQSSDAIVLCSEQSLHILSSAVVGGGLTQARWILNCHVHKGYCHPEPAVDLLAMARRLGVTEPFVGMMTAAMLHRARTVTLQARGVTVAAVITAGLSNPAAPGLSPPVASVPGTINLVLLVDACLTPAAMVNAVITATEAKAQIVLERGTRTPEGHAATGTSTDSMVVACTHRGEVLPYAGPVTPVGWLIGCCVRTALTEALT